MSKIDLNIVEVPDVSANTPAEEMLKEAKLIEAKIPENSYVVSLAIDGKQYSSIEASKHFQELAIRGQSHFTFIIGGSCGIHQDMLTKSDELISFGKITLPHNLARVVLVEQIYRALQIAQGQSYHK